MTKSQLPIVNCVFKEHEYIFELCQIELASLNWYLPCLAATKKLREFDLIAISVMDSRIQYNNNGGLDL
ncbi:unnamed protein product [[Candida] boidinii]|uniref:Unnamed protein product n=1 Tax=Candida boidinii TaxID=5477 RepID=A0A9W6T4Z2_CANBO|nr:unnamed protein product [[Candida] boidinii]GME99456.1 unnamed protein product [[Candida] boidinii]GMG10017.1 unnamed protein product [[Candida] boidinii]